MNRVIKTLIAILTLFSICLITSCSKKYTLEYDANGGIFKNNESIIKEEYKSKISVDLISEIPTKQGYKFIGWENKDNKEIVTGKIKMTKNIILQAKWEEDKAQVVEYTIILDVNGGTALQDSSIKGEAGTELTLPTPTREGYNFLGWYNGEAKFEETVMPEANLILVAKWEEIVVPVVEYTITLDVNGGTALQDSSIKGEAGTELTLPTPTREGYNFLGWFNGETKFEETVMPEENLTLVAKWKEIKYTVTFKDHDGTVLEEEVVSYGSNATAPTVEPREGYTFKGWDKEYTKVLSDLELNAQYELTKYTITFDSNGGNKLTKIEFTIENKNIELPTPTREGYAFLGWYEEEVKVETVENRNYKLTAKWEEIKYTLEYKAMSGTFSDGTNTKSEEYKVNTKVTLLTEVPTLEGYEFIGWYDSETDELISGTVILTKNITLVAKYEEPMFTIEYKTMSGTFSDGTKTKVVKVKVGSLFEYIETPIYGERMFNGWYDTETDEFVAPGTEITSNMQVKAKYRRPGDQYSITYNVNGGLLEVSEVVPYYEGICFVLTVPTKEGFEFEGWYEDEDFTGERVIYQNSDTTGNKVYYAKWKLVDLNYVSIIFNELVPESTSTNLYFPNEYQGVRIFYKSSNTEILSTRGVIDPTHRAEKVTVNVDINIGTDSYLFEREVTVKAIVFEEMKNPVAGYFQTTHLINLTDTMAENLDIAYYAFAHVSATGGVTVNQSAQLTKMMQQAVELRKEKSMRFVLSIAGGAENFAKACANGGYAKVAANIVNIVQKYNMDGVDIDWEFPTTSSESMDMVLLCKTVRSRLQALEDGTGTPYLVTSAIPSHESYQKFNLSDLNEVLDYINMMSYDMNLQGRATHLCPLHRSKYDGNKFGVSLGVEWFEKAGVDREKIIIGAAFYGKSYTVTGNEGNWEALGYPGIGQGAEYKTLQYNSGTVTYKWLATNGRLDSNEFKRYFDPIAMVPYIYNSETKEFITYEDEESLIAKVDYAYENGFGIMFWEYAYDYNNVLTDAICNRMAEYRNQ